VLDSSNRVVNLIVAEPTDPPPPGYTMILKPDLVMVDMGYTWNGENFVSPDGHVSMPTTQHTATEETTET
jgi:hypothetical protein